MEIIPALDLMAGGVVRLRKGELNAVSRYDHMGKPLMVAEEWQRQGARYLHIIDLDGAFDRGDNIETALEISRSLDIPVQFGGGIRDMEKAAMLLDSGVDRVIVGSLAVRQPEKVYELASEYRSDRVAVALDYRNGTVVYRGWTEGSDLKPSDALKDHMEGGVRVFLVTSTERDGTLEGPDTETLTELTGTSKARVIAAGGIGSLKDLMKLQETGVEAAVVGRALYEDCFTLSEALEVV